MSTTVSTSSFVTEVLATAGRLEKEDLNAKLGALSKKTEELKTEVYDALQKKYDAFHPNLRTAIDLSARVEKLSKEMEMVSNKVEKETKAQMTRSATEFQDLSGQLVESNAVLHILERLVNVDKAFKSCETSMKVGDYRQATESLAKANTILSENKGPRDDDIKILHALASKCSTQNQKLIADVAKSWGDALKWDVSEVDKDKVDFRVSLCIRSEDSNREMLGNMVQAMQDLSILTPKLRSFGGNFLKYMVGPILTCKNLTVQMDSSGGSHTLKLNGRKSERRDEVVPPEDVSKSLTMVVSFLHENMFSLPVKGQCEGPTGDDDQNSDASLMRRLGIFIDKTFIEDLIIPKCLSYSIPTNSKDLAKYSEVIKLTEFLEAFLVKVCFLAHDNTSLSDFVNNVNILFANKKCQDIYERACVLMTSEIHNMVKITQDVDPEALPSLGLEGTSSKKAKTAENFAINADKTLSTNTFRLPTCYISISVKDLMDLAYSTLQEATGSDSTPECSVQLFYCVRIVFLLFCDVSPTYHRGSLQDLPQITALYHNNCMYLAHYLLTLGHQFRPRLPQPLNQGAATFIDLVPKLRRLGTEEFERQVSKQKDQVLEYLSGVQGFLSISEDDNYAQAERSIKQLLHQIQLLSNVWKDILPSAVYYKSIGTLLNAAIIEVIAKVTTLDDISARDATQIHSLMSMLTERAPDFFKMDDESTNGKTPSMRVLLHKYIRKWNKFSELMWILNVGMQDIADRWTDGMGPLAAEFSTNEVKQLIRAIFQNTDKRSKVLATIK